jgi:hypothetical protein
MRHVANSPKLDMHTGGLVTSQHAVRKPVLHKCVFVPDSHNFIGPRALAALCCSFGHVMAHLNAAHNCFWRPVCG